MYRLAALALLSTSVALFAGPTTVFAADVAIVTAPPGYIVAPAVRRQLTTYMAKYPFGVLREDYTPLGAPGVSKRDYYGVPRHYAVLHASPRRWAHRYYRRTIVSARY